MGRDSKEVFTEMTNVMNELNTNSEKWFEKGNKSAAGKMRKSTLALDKLGKEFRSLSVAECKK